MATDTAERMAGIMERQASALIWQYAQEIGAALDKAQRLSETAPPVGELTIRLTVAMVKAAQCSVKTGIAWDIKERHAHEYEIEVFDPDQPDLPGLPDDLTRDADGRAVPKTPLCAGGTPLPDDPDPENPYKGKDEDGAEGFFGRSYRYVPAGRQDPMEIGVVLGLADLYLVGWIKPNGSIKRVVSKHLMPTADPDALQTALDAWAEERGLDTASN